MVSPTRTTTWIRLIDVRVRGSRRRWFALPVFRAVTPRHVNCSSWLSGLKPPPSDVLTRFHNCFAVNPARFSWISIGMHRWKANRKVIIFHTLPNTIFSLRDRHVLFLTSVTFVRLWIYCRSIGILFKFKSKKTLFFSRGGDECIMLKTTLISTLNSVNLRYDLLGTAVYSGSLVTIIPLAGLRVCLGEWTLATRSTWTRSNQLASRLLTQPVKCSSWLAEVSNIASRINAPR